MNTLALNIVTPNGSVYSTEQAELVVLQTEGGEMGIMAGHIPTVAPLKIGAVRVTIDKKVEYIAVTEGFAEINGSSVAVLVQAAEESDAINVERAQQSLRRAQERLEQDKKENIDHHRAERALHRAINRLDVAKYR
ncbi:F0F1 ATP synthase subunit epsilon [Macrococcus carouselicus]|uniref:ATP synthase epsilon chain n=1 Tax=Macrococcus carouselicus TaxID=69969 RepID=A0A9Q8CEX2_9STAP|nr:F0F1 ATP synthase subunit epsilon [Macrococcus carouselicus]TDL95393.1 F0F1 ATP synthase subunit epsilon [Macrococcus carouselicus]